MSTLELADAPAVVSDPTRLETFLAQIAPRFQRLPVARLDAEIVHALRELLDALDLDRSSITQFSKGGAAHRVTHASWRPGIPPLQLSDLASDFPWYVEQARRRQRVIFPRIPGDIPAEARAEFAQAASIGMKSLFLFPLDVDREVVGCLALSSFRRPREFSPASLARLDLLASIFATALDRIRLTAEWQASRDFNTALMASISSPVAVLDRYGRIIAVNRAWTAPAPRPDPEAGTRCRPPRAAGGSTRAACRACAPSPSRRPRPRSTSGAGAAPRTGRRRRPPARAAR